MTNDKGFRNYIEVSSALSLFIPGLGQFLLIHWSFSVWFLGAILTYIYLGSGAGVTVHLLCFFHAAMLRCNALRAIG
jgi:hypothetical protein